MAEPNWEAWEQILRDVQVRLGSIERKLGEHDHRFDAIERDLRDLKGMSKYALGAASGAEYQATNAERLVEKVSERLEALSARVDALEGTH